MRSLALLLALMAVIAASGCVSSTIMDMGITQIARTSEAVDQFLAEHPNAEISIQLVKEDSLSSDNDFASKCTSIAVSDLYKVDITDPDSGTTAWAFVDANGTVVCAYAEGSQSGNRQQPSTPQTGNGGQGQGNTRTYAVGEVLNDSSLVNNTVTVVGYAIPVRIWTTLLACSRGEDPCCNSALGNLGLIDGFGDGGYEYPLLNATGSPLTLWGEENEIGKPFFNNKIMNCSGNNCEINCTPLQAGDRYAVTGVLRNESGVVTGYYMEDSVLYLEMKSYQQVSEDGTPIGPLVTHTEGATGSIGGEGPCSNSEYSTTLSADGKYVELTADSKEKLNDKISVEGLSALNGISDLQCLEYFEFDGDQCGNIYISDLSPLENLTYLKILVITGHNITDILPLFRLTELEYLYLFLGPCVKLKSPSTIDPNIICKVDRKKDDEANNPNNQTNDTQAEDAYCVDGDSMCAWNSAFENKYNLSNAYNILRTCINGKWVDTESCTYGCINGTCIEGGCQSHFLLTYKINDSYVYWMDSCLNYKEKVGNYEDYSLGCDIIGESHEEKYDGLIGANITVKGGTVTYQKINGTILNRIYNFDYCKNSERLIEFSCQAPLSNMLPEFTEVACKCYDGVCISDPYLP